MSAPLAFFTDDLFLKHDTGPGHPESPDRLTSVQDLLYKQSYFNQLEMLFVRPATVEEIALNHDKKYIQHVEIFCKDGGRSLDADTIVSGSSYQAAALAVGAGLAAADALLDKKYKRSLLLLRPPGHHSLQDRSMGFCLFNNVAICARYFLSKGMQRVAIVDWDVHHGNGTEASFYDQDNVLFISTHQYPYYPGTGAADDTGVGAGRGFTLNLPMAAGSGDAELNKAFEEQLIPGLKEFQPEVVLISAGFDAHRADPLAMLNLSTEFFAQATRRLTEVADEFANGRVISFLEGGYNLKALAESVEAHAAALLQ